MWKTLPKKTRRVIVITAVGIAALLLFNVLTPSGETTPEQGGVGGGSSAYVPGQTIQEPREESPSASPSETPESGKVDVTQLDLQPMALDYEALALMSTYYYIADGDIGDSARKDIMSVSSADVVEMFDKHWTTKRALVEEYPRLTVFTDATKVSDAPAGENDVAIAILADVFRSIDGGPIEKMGKVRWTVFFDITEASNGASDTANWTISRLTIRVID